MTGRRQALLTLIGWPTSHFAPPAYLRTIVAQMVLDIAKDTKKRNCGLARDVIDLEAQLQMAKVVRDGVVYPVWPRGRVL